MTDTSPEIARSLTLGDCAVNVHDVGQGEPILLIHGSGPGVTAWANWRGVIPVLGQRARVVAPDMLGFGYTRCPPDQVLDPAAWVWQLVDLMDALDLPAAHVVGNSFGGAIALALAHRHPERVKRLVLMGAVGVSFPISAGLDKVWGYQPSLGAMRELIGLFAFDQSIVTDDLVRMRHAASTRADVQERFARLFPPPRQRGVDMLALPEAALRTIAHRTLIVHGRDDRVIPLEVSERLLRLLPHADLHVFGECGHWVQIEKLPGFLRLVSDFLLESKA
ncbi:MAG: alpha/beta fold hydrolase [Burkholderiales bacterium]|uniref:Alpha/beta fold hydrolase n=1 Tax=Ottowia pentelensis TaxID=511108 RepID=A0ABV6PQ01_9BURK|nr:alpha/beta hydrolase [Ottowia sp.]MBN9405103.1 alpha/beta fold hydrolase [Burkholderiales bacterium]MBS0404364.1 alpha/beta fold hydrolase [Pseudomonadota bacterium]MBS0413419.1 alpha/beta fold hydrolase [Pseudomonadota bacterium]